MKKQVSITPSSKKHSRFKKCIIIFVVVIILLAAGGAGWWLFGRQKVNISKSDAIATMPKAMADARASAEKSVGSGDTEAAIKSYDSAIKDATDVYQKNILLLDKAMVYFNDSNYDQALSVAQEAEAAYKDDGTESFIAQIYEKKGDNANAAAYYAKAIALIDKTQPMADIDAKYYQSKIDELTGARG